MADYVLGGGFFSRALGDRAFRDDIQSRNKTHAPGPLAPRDASTRRGGIPNVPLAEALRIAKPEVLAPTLPEPPKETQKKPANPDSSLDTSTVDQLVRGYVDFLKSIDFYSDDANNPEAALTQADDLVHRITQPLGIADGDIAELNLTSEFTLAEVYQQYVTQNGAGVDAGASYAAAAHAHLQADIVTKDGRAFHVELTIDAQMSSEIALHLEQQQQSQAPSGQCDPITMDLDGDGKYSLSDVGGGVAFDINADGIVDQSSFVQGADAFLALDRNGNGKIDDGGELFGDQHGAKNGYAELAKFDSDGNGKIDANDAVLSQLVALRRNEDGSLSQQSISSLGIDSFSLDFKSEKSQTSGGNTITESGQFFRSSIAYNLADINLGYGTLSKEA